MLHLEYKHNPKKKITFASIGILSRCQNLSYLYASPIWLNETLERTWYFWYRTPGRWEKQHLEWPYPGVISRCQIISRKLGNSESHWLCYIQFSRTMHLWKCSKQKLSCNKKQLQETGLPCFFVDREVFFQNVSWSIFRFVSFGWVLPPKIGGEVELQLANMPPISAWKQNQPIVMLESLRSRERSNIPPG